MCAIVKEEIVHEEIDIEENYDLNVLKQELKEEAVLEAFNEQTQLTSHIVREDDNEKKFKCDVCGKSFKNAKLVHIHKKVKHATEKPFLCEVCAQSFAAAWLLKKHCRSHSAKRPYQCEQCSKAFKEKAHLTNHKRHMHDRVVNEKDIKCDECDKSFKRASDFSLHKKFMHATEKPFQCEMCPKNFVTARVLKNHTRTHPSHKCDQCSEAFTKQSQLSKHIVKVHDNAKTIKCDECDKLFRKPRDVSLHKTFMHATDQPFQCEVCLKSFATAGFLKSHSTSHSAKKPYDCDRCSETFEAQSQLIYHIVQMHGNDEENKCHELLKSTQDGSAHDRNSHATGKPSQCEGRPKYPKGSATSSILETLLRNHDVDTPYKVRPVP